MQHLQKIFWTTLFSITIFTVAFSNDDYRIDGEKKEITFKYWSYNNLIVLSTIINDHIKVNLVLDTGSPNLILFGKKFQNMFDIIPDKKIKFPGIGAGNPSEGLLSINNKVSISEVLGEKVTVIVVPRKKVFYNKIDGIIGYELFTQFEIEINPGEKTITFRSPFSGYQKQDYSTIALKMVSFKPVINSSIIFNDNKSFTADLLIDTGSTLGLLFQTSDSKYLSPATETTRTGKGINGRSSIYESIAKHLKFGEIEIMDLKTNIIQSTGDNSFSIGMAFLKNYILVLNYCTGKAYLKKIV